MDTLSYKTASANKNTVERKWYVIDAENQIVGRLASRIATMLRGKHKPDFTPHVDNGDHIIVLNAGKIRFTGSKAAQKEYITYSGYPGGQKRMVAAEQLEKKPFKVLETAVKGMLPKTKLGNSMIKKLHLYEGAEHPHQAQQPEQLNLDK